MPEAISGESFFGMGEILREGLKAIAAKQIIATPSTTMVISIAK